MTPKLRRFLDQVRPSTPYLVVDVDVVEANYLALAAGPGRRADLLRRQGQPGARRSWRRLAALGSSFDVASPAEVAMALAAGAEPTRISYGNTIKKEADIAGRLRAGRAAVRRSTARPSWRRSPVPRPAPRCSAAS